MQHVFPIKKRLRKKKDFDVDVLALHELWLKYPIKPIRLILNNNKTLIYGRTQSYHY